MDLKVEDLSLQQQVSPSPIKKLHDPDCQKQPSSCSCVAWFVARSGEQVKSDRCGKWIIRPEKQCVDEIWEKTTRLLSKNELGNRAVVSTKKQGDEHIICLYTNDFEDVQDVFRVLVTLQRKELEDDFFTYVTEETRVTMYGSPPLCNGPKTEFTEFIRMYKYNIGPESKTGLVVELKKSSKRNIKEKITFYNPPKILPTYSSESRPCKYDELDDKENGLHKPHCNKQPSTCYCENVSWIWAYQLVRVKSIHSGKWLLFPDKKNVDEVWEKVKILLAANRLGNGAKVSKGKPANEHVVCIYNKDFENVQDVFRVLVTIRRNRLQDTFINYKTDEATLEGVYKTDEAAQRAGFDSTKKLEPGKRVSMYFSPPSPIDLTGATELIQLFLNNIGPENSRGLVAELKKEAHDIEAKIIFYDPPKILAPSYRSQGFVPKPYFKKPY